MCISRLITSDTTGKSENGCLVRVPALSSGASRFEPWSWHLVKAAGGIWGPCKIGYDWWYKRDKSLWGNISDRLSVVSVRAETQSLRECEAQQHSAKVWLQGAWKIWSLKWPAPPKGTPEVLYLYLLLDDTSSHSLLIANNRLTNTISARP